MAFAVGRMAEGCDIFAGKWVRDEERKPMYEERECPYIQPQLTCQEHGRPDRDYQLWRWQPHACDLPKCVPITCLLLEALKLAFLQLIYASKLENFRNQEKGIVYFQYRIVQMISRLFLISSRFKTSLLYQKNNW